jgi:Leucine-rich repeat (LRR) protein
MPLKRKPEAPDAIAEDRVQAALSNKNNNLYLVGLALTSLPESLSKLTSLQSLDLSKNQLTSLPEWLGKLTSLQSLDLSHNPLTSLPESLSKLTSLQTL